MATAYQTLNFFQNQPSGTGHGFYKTHSSLHAISGVISTWVTGDTIAVGYLSRQAIVTSVLLKAASQLDSNGSPTLTFDVGVVGAPQLFKAAVSTVGRTSGATIDITNTAAGWLYQNVSGVRQEILVTVHAGAATPVAGTVEVDIEYYVEDIVGSPP
jgi:hypothetical protein